MSTLAGDVTEAIAGRRIPPRSLDVVRSKGLTSTLNK